MTSYKSASTNLTHRRLKHANLANTRMLIRLAKLNLLAIDA